MIKEVLRRLTKHRSEGTAVVSGIEQESIDLSFTVTCFPMLFGLMMSLPSTVFVGFCWVRSTAGTQVINLRRSQSEELNNYTVQSNSIMLMVQ